MSLTGKPDLPQARPVLNDGWWPNLQVGDLISQYRIPAEYDQDVIVTGIRMAILHVNRRLKEVKTALAADYLTFAAYVADKGNVDGKPSLELHYANAVYSTAKANLLQQFNSMNRRPNAEAAAKEAPEMESHWLDQAEASIAEIIRAAIPGSTPVSDHGVYVGLL
jgi:Phage head completion protein (GPL)